MNNDIRERDQLFENALLCSPLFNTGNPVDDRQSAVHWGENAYANDLSEPFTPSGHGVLDAGFWPADTITLIELNEKGRLPDEADLEYGVTADDIEFHGIRRLDDGSFIAVVCGDVNYAKKLDVPIAAEESMGG